MEDGEMDGWTDGWMMKRWIDGWMDKELIDANTWL